MFITRAPSPTPLGASTFFHLTLVHHSLLPLSLKKKKKGRAFLPRISMILHPDSLNLRRREHDPISAKYTSNIYVCGTSRTSRQPASHFVSDLKGKPLAHFKSIFIAVLSCFLTTNVWSQSADPQQACCLPVWIPKTHLPAFKIAPALRTPPTPPPPPHPLRRRPRQQV